MKILSTAMAAFLASTAAVAGDLKLELNKLEDQKDACRAYLVLQNNTEAFYEELKLDLVMFGTEGVIAKRLALDVAPLRPSKTSIRLFDMAGLACTDIGRILINDVIACRDEGGERTDCIALVEPSSRHNVSLVK